VARGSNRLAKGRNVDLRSPSDPGRMLPGIDLNFIQKFFYVSQAPALLPTTGGSMAAVAIKKGQTREQAPAFKEMGTLRCDGCGEEFIVFHDPAFVDKAVAERQAQWLEKVLAEEHERERKHPDRIELPD